jgi:hypothetical protein
MFTLVTALLCVAVAADKPSSLDTPLKPHPLFPSLHELSEQEENRLDEIVNRFIEYDSGKLKGPEGKKALADFQKLGPDAIPALLRGLNNAARIEHSCPAVQITRKLAKMLTSSRDIELLEFARENAGAGIEHSRHLGIIKDLRVLCMFRKRAVLDSAAAKEQVSLKGTLSAPADPFKKSVQKMTLTELVEAAGKEREEKLKAVLLELGSRRGDKAIAALGSAAATYEGDMQKLAREQLGKQLARLKKEALKEKFSDDRAEVRAAAARVAGIKTLHCEKELIGLLGDDEKSVSQAAHDALVQLAGGADFGPRPDAGPAERREAVQKWRAWLDRVGGR